MRYYMIVDTDHMIWYSKIFIMSSHTIDFDDNEEIEQGEEQITFDIERDITALRYLLFQL